MPRGPHKRKRSRIASRDVTTMVGVAALLGGLALIGMTFASQIPEAFSVATGVVDKTMDRALASAELQDSDLFPVRVARERPGSPQVSVGPVMKRSRPVFLDIAAIDVRSDIHALGLEENGALEVPTGSLYDDAGWYRYSPTPGSLGPAILLGHVDSAADGPSVFFHLGGLQRGDDVVITRADGSVATFEVDLVHRYPKRDFPTDRVYGDIDHAGLRILTCGGAFDDATGRYLDNVVVFAALTSYAPSAQAGR